MDKDTRNAIERVTQRARKLLEEDFAAQLEGDFDVHRDGAVTAKAGGHLSARQAFQRERIVAAIEHKRAAGMSAADAARDYLRDAAFTTLNRFVALKMLEARDLVQECITKGEQSAGYREFCGMAPGLPLLPDSAGYRLYIESLFDELSTEVKVLFDRRDPSSVLWPKRATFEHLLEILNATELARVWGEDETIGWVYQFFNGQDERRKMREESQAPRNSRELAVRNQFFTPRYVVQFLTDNTLGRIWYEMRGTKTALADKCEYMVRKPGEVFAPRARKDPRDLRVLDPACGSGHFLLYAFDLLLAIYEEAYADPESPTSEATGRTVAEDYPSLDALKKAVPGLVLAHNLHGVDIDPRCAQIAQLALWMRAQKAYRDFGIGRGERAQIRRSNIVVAEPLVADDQIAKEFVAKLGDAELGRVFTSMVESLNLAGDLGLLLPLEQVVSTRASRGTTGDLFAPPEERIRSALARFVVDELGRDSTRRRLFLDDAGQALALLHVAEQQYDVILMNPPFGDATVASRDQMAAAYPRSKHEICAAFVDRCIGLLSPDGMLGSISTRLVLFNQSLSDWREYLFEHSAFRAVADLGHGVLDAMVETALYVIAKSRRQQEDAHTAVAAVLSSVDKEGELSRVVARSEFRWCNTDAFRKVPGAPFSYWVPESLLQRFREGGSFLSRGGTVGPGIITGDDFRFFRLRWEVPQSDVVTSITTADAVEPRNAWIPVPKGGEYQLWHDSIDLVLKWHCGGREVRNFTDEAGKLRSRPQNLKCFFRPGATYPYRTTSALGVRLLPNGCAFSNGGWGVFPPAGWSQEQVAAVYNSRIARYFVEVLLGSGDSASSGTAARNYGTEVVGGIPWPREMADVHVIVRELAQLWRLLDSNDLDSSSRYITAAQQAQSISDAAQRAWKDLVTAWERILELQAALERRVEDAYELSDAERDVLAEAEGASLSSLPHGSADPGAMTSLFSMPVEQLVEYARSRLGGRRFVVKKSYFVDRVVDLASQALGIHAADVLRSCRAVDIEASGFVRTVAVALVHTTLLSAFQRVGDWGILVDDPGHKRDLRAAMQAAAKELLGGSGVEVLEGALDLLAGKDHARALRDYLFTAHVERFSGSRRRAPVCWQLATPSAGYSVWLYIHAFSKDTLFRVQNDYVAPKLAHEEKSGASSRSPVSCVAGPPPRSASNSPRRKGWSKSCAPSSTR